MNSKLKNFLIVVKTNLEQTVFRLLPDETYLRLYFRLYRGEKLHLNNPKTFNEKLQWLKLYDRKKEYVIWADKYCVKKYIEEKIGAEYVVPLLGVWNTFDEIDKNLLPNQFVLKTTHDSGGVVICRDKSKFDWKKAKRIITRSLRINYYYAGREWPYKDIQPKIIAEKYLEDENDKTGIIDYKFYCFNGIPRFLYVSGGLENHETAKISFCDINYHKAPFKRVDYDEFEELPPKPVNFEKMIELATILSKDTMFLRVDFFEVNSKLYFSELTFTPRSGLMKFEPNEYDLIWGNELHIL